MKPSPRRLVPLLLILGSVASVRAASPDPPNNVSPPDGNVQVPAETTLCAQVTDPDLDPLNVRFLARELTAPTEVDFTILTIPDSQFYTQRHPDMFYAQTDWIVEQRAARNIVFVAHVGDIVHLAAGDFEWSIASEAMSRLEDPTTTLLEDGIAFGMAVGNHDQFPNNNAGTLADPGATTQNFNSHFGLSRFEGRSYWGGHYGDNNDNSYQLFSAGGMDFIVINLEHADWPDPNPLRDDVLAWADALLKTHADRRAIINSHHILCVNQGCPPTISAPFSLQGQAIYDALKNNPNLFLMLAGHAGHADYQNRRLDIFEGRVIHTLMSNYHFGEPCPYLCGNGYMRVMTFSPATDQIDVKTYSPYLDQYKTTEHNQFVLDYDMNGGRHFREVGSVAAAGSGSTPCIQWSGLSDGAQYEWYVEVSDGTETVEGPRWTFTDNGSCTSPAECDDGDPCTTDNCAGLACTHDVIANCCVGAGDCDDGNPCTDDQCAAGNCTHADNTKPCSDGDACTQNDVCSQGACSGTPLACDDGNACTDDVCGRIVRDRLPAAGRLLHARRRLQRSQLVLFRHVQRVAVRQQNDSRMLPGQCRVRRCGRLHARRVRATQPWGADPRFSLRSRDDGSTRVYDYQRPRELPGTQRLDVHVGVLVPVDRSGHHRGHVRLLDRPVRLLRYRSVPSRFQGNP